jgi:N-acetylmuramate 1-kinase
MSSGPLLPENILSFLRDQANRIAPGEAVQVFPLAGDASTRKYFRVVAGDQSRVLMSWEPFKDPENYPFLNVSKHFSACDIKVPKVESLSAELGVVLLEDLGDLTLERKFWENQDQELAMPYYRQAIEEIVKIHFRASRSSGSKPSICQTLMFDTEKFMWEMNYARDHLVEKLAGVVLTDSRKHALAEEHMRLCRLLHEQPKYVCHRDYHSRNLMIKHGQVRVIDFQDARLGPIQYDLVSLLHDSYVDLSQHSREQLLAFYRELAIVEGPTQVLRDDFSHVFVLQTIQRCFKACGSFASFYNARSDTRYLKYIRSTLGLVQERLSDVKKDFPVFLELVSEPKILDRDFTDLCAP